MIRLIVPLTFAVVTIHAGQAFAQGAFPAPLPNGQAAPAASSAPAAGGASPFPREKWPASDSCMKGFAPLREEAEKRGKLIKAASERHARPDEACKLIGQYSQSELKMMKYIDANSAECGASPQIAEQLRNGHRNTEAMEKKVCAVAAQRPTGPVGDFWPASKREPVGLVGDFWLVR